MEKIFENVNEMIKKHQEEYETFNNKDTELQNKIEGLEEEYTRSAERYGEDSGIAQVINANIKKSKKEKEDLNKNFKKSLAEDKDFMNELKILEEKKNKLQEEKGKMTEKQEKLKVQKEIIEQKIKKEEEKKEPNLEEINTNKDIVNRAEESLKKMSKDIDIVENTVKKIDRFIALVGKDRLEQFKDEEKLKEEKNNIEAEKEQQKSEQEKQEEEQEREEQEEEQEQEEQEEEQEQEEQEEEQEQEEQEEEQGTPPPQQQSTGPQYQKRTKEKNNIEIKIGRNATIRLGDRNYKVDKKAIKESLHYDNDKVYEIMEKNGFNISDKTEMEKVFASGAIDPTIIGIIDHANIDKEAKQKVMGYYIKDSYRASNMEYFKKKLDIVYDEKNLSKANIFSRLFNRELNGNEKAALVERGRMGNRYGMSKSEGEYKPDLLTRIKARFTRSEVKALPTVDDQHTIASIYNDVKGDRDATEVKGKDFKEQLRDLSQNQKAELGRLVFDQKMNAKAKQARNNEDEGR